MSTCIDDYVFLLDYKLLLRLTFTWDFEHDCELCLSLRRLGFKFALLSNRWLLTSDLWRWSLLFLLKFDRSQVEQVVELMKRLRWDQVKRCWSCSRGLLSRSDVASQGSDSVLTFLDVFSEDILQCRDDCNANFTRWALITLVSRKTLHECEL